MLNTANYNKLSQVSSSFEVVFQFRNDFTPLYFLFNSPSSTTPTVVFKYNFIYCRTNKDEIFHKKGGVKKEKKEKKFSNFNKRWILLKFYAMFWFPVCRYLCYLSTAFLAATQCRNTREKMHGDNFTAFYIKRDLLSWPGIKKQLC